jgi:DNA mismatch repair protein MutL
LYQAFGLGPNQIQQPSFEEFSSVKLYFFRFHTHSIPVNRIRILPDQVANQIAAGEVIERPASVLKELVENAIDARANSIRVEIRGGGKTLIRVSDTGFGMSRDDALLCLERHATSKIHDSADIGSVHTLGFRGEAIPSIASVSRFRLLSRESESPTGVEIEVNGGKLLNVKEAGCTIGTQVEVRNLFYNLPARRKFLRSDATEIGHLHHVFLLHAIAQPHIAWTLQQDERMVHELAPSDSNTPFQTALLNRVRTLHGPQLASNLLPMDSSRYGVRIFGLLGKAGLSRSNRSELYCFVNSRPVDSRAIYYGLIEGYHNALMRGRYPVCFLFLEVDPTTVDVNIHPAKREVRFREDARVQGAVIEAVRKALGISSGTSSNPSPVTTHLPSPHLTPAHLLPPKQGPGSVSPVFPSFRSPQFPISSSSVTQPLLSNIPSQSLVSPPRTTSDFLHSPSPFQVLGVFANLYVVALDSEGLLIVDQHAAHERILYEQMIGRFAKKDVVSQRLLLPQTIELSPKDSAELKEHMEVLEKMGFGISEFGDRSFLIDALPLFVKIETLPQLIRSVLDELNEAGKGINRDRLSEEVIAKTVCRHAVKANDILRVEELERMLIDLQACTNPLTCPHGRPTILRLTQTELERKFGRRPLE